jgi:hypothetical protein
MLKARKKSCTEDFKAILEKHMSQEKPKRAVVAYYDDVLGNIESK